MKKKKTKSQRIARDRRNACRRKANTHRFRSGLEDRVIEDLEIKGIPYEYESMKIPYVKPSSSCTYNPDLLFYKKVGGLMFVEIKGRLDLITRKKHEYLRVQYPDLDLRFVFGDWNNRIYKNSPTTYRHWADNLGIPCANKVMPQEWIDEIEGVRIESL